MPLLKVKPTSPGRRGVVKVVSPDLYKGDPYAPLTEPQAKTGGRNHHGRITTRHRGGGSRQHYRLIDFKRDKDGIAAKIERVEYDPNRTAHIALLLFVDGERRYIIAPKGAKVGDTILSGRDAPIKNGNCLPLRNGNCAPTLLTCMCAATRRLTAWRCTRCPTWPHWAVLPRWWWMRLRTSSRAAWTGRVWACCSQVRKKTSGRPG